MSEKKPQSKTSKDNDAVTLKLTSDITLAGKEKQKGDSVTVDKATANWLQQCGTAEGGK